MPNPLIILLLVGAAFFVLSGKTVRRAPPTGGPPNPDPHDGSFPHADAGGELLKICAANAKKSGEVVGQTVSGMCKTLHTLGAPIGSAITGVLGKENTTKLVNGATTAIKGKDTNLFVKTAFEAAQNALGTGSSAIVYVPGGIPISATYANTAGATGGRGVFAQPSPESQRAAYRNGPPPPTPTDGSVPRSSRGPQLTKLGR